MHEIASEGGGGGIRLPGSEMQSSSSRECVIIIHSGEAFLFAFSKKHNNGALQRIEMFYPDAILSQESSALQISLLLYFTTINQCNANIFLL